MNKFFAKTFFLGKKTLFLPQCHSTNEELTKRSGESADPPEGTVVYTDHQDSGRGQRGNKWIAAPGKNVLMSVLLRPKFLAPEDQYYLNLISGLAIVDTIREKIVGKDVWLKWPNDVYIDGRKIAGILIESSFRGDKSGSSVIGIGLNVNQLDFDKITATSIKLQTGDESDLDREEIMERLLIHLEGWYLKLKNGTKEPILNTYHRLLMWRGEIHTFKSGSGEFKGEITGINESGKLTIRVGTNLKVFDVKEVAFVS